jgi:hypothetical protein
LSSLRKAVSRRFELARTERIRVRSLSPAKAHVCVASASGEPRRSTQRACPRPREPRFPNRRVSAA